VVTLGPLTETVLGPNAKRIEVVKSCDDRSYKWEKVAGPGYFMVGDAAAFLDPWLSSGVHMAHCGGLLAAGCIQAMENVKNIVRYSHFF
jgi:halogenation protein CepH